MSNNHPHKEKEKLSREQRFGLTVSVTTHMVLILIAWMMYSAPVEQDRIALMEVTLGEFREGAPARHAPEQADEPEPEPEPEPETEPEPTPQPEPEPEDARPVELPEQPEPVPSEDVVVSPPVEEVDPEATEPEPDIEPEEIEPIRPDPVPEPDPRQRPRSLLSGNPDDRADRDTEEDGTARDEDRSAPYLLEWEGNISRQPQVNPLPSYTVDVEAVITVRFAVRPDGTVGSVTPLRRTDPDLENEVIRTIRTWRFNRLPSGVPQEVQHGTVTFRFVLD